ncbi:hypothetical protein COT51_00885 [candidate division WWE3 bacterium CG08_land_8_20_14_0_20_41_15]|uniref:CopG family transcriptional regulator n=1 Tax=candidate division WWE3 bacterium CG08_land_8_20_14_0_20_41_15 TaxID=1975086 RepID=A0A2H0XA29_UNCKA|nr:MAG: hypothetical protein COT51_00885 [candidate division WWE3 bacterium CG08_land_8_20_14_0_20_41_15]
MKRITITIPKHIHDLLEKNASERGVSSLVVEAIEKELAYREFDPVSKIREIQKDMPPVTMEKILKAIRKGRV